VNALPAGRVEALLHHVAEIAQLDVKERDIPQHGMLSLPAAQGVYQLSASLIPLAGGGLDLVLGFQNEAQQALTLEELGFTPGTLRAFQRLLEQPAGLVLFTGPMGSGRTTSMHAALASFDGSRLKIWAAEEAPSHQSLEQAGLQIRQLQVKPHLGFGFSSALRCLLRADADVILVGELDDRETARVALDGVHAGRRILSTLNARSAFEGMARLLEMSLDAHAIGQSLRGVLAQRLVRRLCAECRQAVPATLNERDELARACRSVQVDSLLRWVFEPDLAFWQRRGCKMCQGSGYDGYMALHELLVVDSQLARAIAERAPVTTLRELAYRSGMTTLLQDGIAKALAGMTDLSQVLNALGSI
jgi:type II secretory ATPase GspE/PulE/Tfp pilus assembly ATPase PilB-like protein